MNTLIAKYIYLSGARFRNPSLNKIYRVLKQQEHLPLHELKKIQFNKLKDLLIFAYNHSEYYSKIFKKLNFDPNTLSSLNDIKQLPIIDKNTLISQNKKIHTDYPFRKVMLAETSGTSGEALEFYRNESWDSCNRANVMRHYDWYGVNIWERNGYFWGYNIDQSKSGKVNFLDCLQNRKRIFRYDETSITNFVKEVGKVKYLSGYSSMIYQIAKKINQLEINLSGIKMVKGTSEMILEAYQPEILKAFGQRMISEYGAAESGLIAFECPEGSMHVNMESVLVETDSNDEIIITNLVSHSFPIIRYRLGDIVKISSERCKCGRAHILIREIIGRKGKNIVGRKTNYPALTFYYVFKNIAIEHGILINYKAEQFKKGNVTLHIEGEWNPQQNELIEKEMLKYFNNDLTYELIYTKTFEPQIKKQQYFESYINE